MFNPLQSPILTLGLSLLLGVIQILVGMTVKTVTMIKRGKLIQALGQQVSWISLLTGLVMFAYPMCYMFIGESAPAWAEAIGDVGIIIAGVGLVLLLLLGGYGQKGLGRIFGGVSSLMDITSYLSDILSYARLFGLGLATGVIGMVVKYHCSDAGRRRNSWLDICYSSIYSSSSIQLSNLTHWVHTYTHPDCST